MVRHHRFHWNIAEVGKHAVDHVLSDEAAGRANRLGAAAVIDTDDLTHVLGVEPGRERRRPASAWILESKRME